MTRFGFIGLGAMGLNMARNIAAKMKPSDTLHVFDVAPAQADLVPGAIKASRVSEVAANADTVITMLPMGKHVSGVFNEIVAAVGRDGQKQFIDSSTIDIATSRAVASKVAAAGHRFVDAPVSGGTAGAKAGTLTFMVGAPEIEGSLQVALELMGKRLFACGQQSSGLAAKLANNYILALTNLATSEGFALAKHLGLDLATFSQLVDVSSGQSWSSRVNNPVPGVDANTPSSRDYENGFAVDLCRKDLLLAVEAAQGAAMDLPLGKHAPAVYTALSEAGLGKKDMSILYKTLLDHK
ncbi:putative 3-hydroxyisobutyrate dehydrogenase, mitochondrial [Wickerhamiella sorbophila]|uniref:3-hydroxyisobutyrate dehydrogenase n=1 Tax=Wickerhamiella sorbophila TaxID=45607 RepID=A0A2T0FFT8_9ASCO|nr:putative 3-hydroxyisobutyrate dehydrogenase, mitochondrial [Wickerhamiella sorbophila]PRT53858.1 putative 3-hydroxyisobutyrate dehydrogenase, mitochondrial [Wickerhamiella sorbophila]